jgi:hypothetical protein
LVMQIMTRKYVGETRLSMTSALFLKMSKNGGT